MKVIMLFPTLKQMKRGESQLKELEKKAEKAQGLFRKFCKLVIQFNSSLNALSATSRRGRAEISCPG